MRHLYQVYGTLQPTLRRETFHGREHLVAPVVAVVEGVIQGLNSPGPELATAREFAKAPGAWNGRPVTQDHPTLDGDLTSASDPRVLETYGIGTVFNAELQGDKLTLEAWVDVERARGTSVLERLEALERGEDVGIEVSVGAFLDAVPQKGTFKGKPYQYVWKDVKPDHLALLEAGAEGACSIEDGCGVRAFCGTREPQGCRCEGFDSIRARVEAKFLQGVARCAEALTPSTFSQGESFNDLQRGVVMALAEAEPELFSLHAIFRDTVVYETWDSPRLFERGWSQEGDQITIAEDITSVRPITRYVAAGEQPRASRRGAPQKENTMDRETLIGALIANERAPWGEDDRPELDALSDERLTACAQAFETSPRTREEVEADAEALGLRVEASDADVLAPEDRAILEAAKAERSARLEKLRNKIKSFERNPYTDEELGEMTLEQLQKAARLAGMDEVEPREPASFARPIPDGGSLDDAGFAPSPPRMAQALNPKTDGAA